MGILERIFNAALANILSTLKSGKYDSSQNFWEKYDRYEQYKKQSGQSNSYERARSYYDNYYKNKYNYQHNQQQKSEPKNDKIAQYYANLELPYGASLEEVRKSWKRLLKIYHPDKHSQDKEKLKVATVLTQKLNEAYFALEKELKNK